MPSRKRKIVTKIKRTAINTYYDLLMLLEDLFDSIGTAINNHRKVVDEKYWAKYIRPHNWDSAECRQRSPKINDH